ncbi:MAG TPA: hypothetical protein VMQ61_03095 [Thermoanaerobaculia bacterium]|nr:hypothetical protein [Thermoanaerobaculia bacterium]
MRAGLVLALLSCAAAAMRAEDRPLILEPAAGQRVLAGDAVRVRWSDVPADVEEQELLLSLDGGRHFRLVTRRLDPSARDYRWVVPNLASAEAVLALRVGDQRGEILAGRSAAFTIAASGDEGAGDASEEDEETWAPLPDGWEGPVPLSDRRVGAAWMAHLDADASGALPPREIAADPPTAGRTLESFPPAAAPAASERLGVPPLDPPRRL